MPGIMEYVDQRLGKQFQQMENVVTAAGAVKQSRNRIHIRKSGFTTPGDDAYEGDAEDSPRKSRTRTQAENIFHVHLLFHSYLFAPDCIQAGFRTFLVNKGVLKSPPPEPAPKDRILKFQRDHSGGPNANAPIQMDWLSSLSSPWNREAISILSVSFLNAIEAGEILAVKPDPERKVGDIMRLCSAKLSKTRSTYNRSLRESAEGVRARAQMIEKRNRANTRRHGVSSDVLCTI